ncbi:MAG: hypothetical protein J5797_06370 [Prevotella sp.]|nr:hypothetical protein [Prevotella sp.]
MTKGQQIKHLRIKMHKNTLVLLSKRRTFAAQMMHSEHQLIQVLHLIGIRYEKD